MERAPATHAKALEGSRRVHTTRIAFAAFVAAICCVVSAAAAALSTGPSLQQREFLQATMAARGLPVPPGLLRSPGFDWAGTLTPAAIAALLIVVVSTYRQRRCFLGLFVAPDHGAVIGRAGRPESEHAACVFLVARDVAGGLALICHSHVVNGASRWCGTRIVMR